MGQTPAKNFKMPTPFGSSPQTNNVSQAQPYQQVGGPGFAAFGGFDQTQQAPQKPPAQAPTQNLFGGGFGVNRIDWMNQNPFKGLLNQ